MELSRRAALVSGVVSLSGCTAVARIDSSEQIQGPPSWETYGRGPTHRASYERGAIPNEAPSVDQRERLYGNRVTSPVASEEFVAVGDERDVLVVPFADGELSRRLEPPGTVAGTPCLDDGTIYVTSDGRYGETDAAHASAMTADGETTWQVELDSDRVTSPTMRDGTVYVRTDEAYLALDAASGETRWRNGDAPSLTSREADLDTLPFENFGPAVGSDVAVFPDLDGITAIDPAEGTARWRRELEKVRAYPAIADGTAYVSDVGLGVHAFDLESGDRRWRWSSTGGWAPPAVSNGRIFASDGFDVLALDRETGDLEWRTGDHGLHGDVLSGFSVVGDTILASSTGFGLVTVRTNSGGLLDGPGAKRWHLGGSGHNTPIAVGDRIVYVKYDADGPTLQVLR